MALALSALVMLSGCQALAPQSHTETIYILNQQDPTPGLQYQVIVGPILNHFAWGLTDGIKSGQVVEVQIDIVDRNNGKSWFLPLLPLGTE